MVTESLYSSIWVPVCGWEKGKEEAMQEKQRVSDMAVEVLARQASGRAKRTGELLEDALKAILDTEAGRQFANSMFSFSNGGVKSTERAIKEAKRSVEEAQRQVKEAEGSRSEAERRAEQAER